MKRRDRHVQGTKMRALLTRFMTISSLIAGMVVAGVGFAAEASAAASDTLAAGQQLTVGQSLVSADGRYSAVMQGDGNFVVYGPSGAKWNTGSSSANHIVMQGDGNLVAYNSANNYTWSSSTATSHNDRVVMQSDGNLVIYSGANIALWVNGAHLQGADTLAAGQQLTVGQSLVSADGRYSAVMQGDGNFVFGPRAPNGTPVAAARTTSSCRATETSSPTTARTTTPGPAARPRVQATGSLCRVTATWSSTTGRTLRSGRTELV